MDFLIDMENIMSDYLSYIFGHILGTPHSTEIEIGLYLDDLTGRSNFKEFDSKFKVGVMMRNGEHSFRPSALLILMEKKASGMGIEDYILNPRFMLNFYHSKSLINEGYDNFISERDLANVQSV